MLLLMLYRASPVGAGGDGSGAGDPPHRVGGGGHILFGDFAWLTASIRWKRSRVYMARRCSSRAPDADPARADHCSVDLGAETAGCPQHLGWWCRHHADCRRDARSAEGRPTEGSDSRSVDRGDREARQLSTVGPPASGEVLSNESPTKATYPSTWEKLLFGVPLRRVHRLLPGIGLALVVTLVADRFSVGFGWLALKLQGLDPTGRPNPISAMTCSVLLGLTLGNSVGLHPMVRPGVDFSVKKLLRLGIILVGIRLSLLDVMRLGIWGIPVVMVVIISALFLTNWISNRLGLSARMGALAAASTAICGVTAAMAVAPLIEADEQELAYTVANVTIFGMLAMLVYPYLAHFLFGSQSGAIGLFLGTAITTRHSHGGALAYKDVFGDELALKIATVTSSPATSSAPCVPALTFHFARKAGRDEARQHRQPAAAVLRWFLAMAILRSAESGDRGTPAGAFGIWRPPSGRVSPTRWVTLATIALGGHGHVGMTTNLKACAGWVTAP